jgi:hypothetical protein
MKFPFPRVGVTGMVMQMPQRRVLMIEKENQP